jgi:ComF family protein
MFPLTVTRIFQDFLSLIYPNCCAACSDALVKGEELICSRCILELPQTYYHLDIENPLKRRLSGRFPIQFAWSYVKFSKSGNIQRLLHNLKYRNQPEIAIVLGKVFAQRIRESGVSFYFDIIIPVPLHKSRLRKRGYNQSAKFAQGLSQGFNIPWAENILIRKTQTETQTRKTKLKRWENVSAVFDLEDAFRVQGKHILLVDDVITTGATIEACAKVLTEGGCRIVSVISIAVA